MRAWRLAFAALAAAAVIDIVVEGLPHASFSIANFVSYFTIESNLAGIVVLSAAAVRVPMPPRFEAIRGAVTLYLVVTGIIYNALLRDVGVGIAAEWTNVVVHLVMPVVVLFDWLLVPPARAIAARTALIWLAYPLCYLAYSVVRGPIVDWYPYPFIDPGHTAATVASRRTPWSLPPSWAPWPPQSPGSVRRSAARTIATSPSRSEILAAVRRTRDGENDATDVQANRCHAGMRLRYLPARSSSVASRITMRVHAPQ